MRYALILVAFALLTGCASMRSELDRHHIVTLTPAEVQHIRDMLGDRLPACDPGKEAHFVGVRRMRGSVEMDVRCE